MRLLRFNLNIPFWCSFAEYGTLNIQQTYPFPPPPTIFGMILNAFGKPAVHTISDDVAKQRLIEEYLRDYSKLRCSIVVRDMGEKIDDYLNVLKGNRDKKASRSALNDRLSSEIKKFKKENKNLSESGIKDKINRYTLDFWKSQVENYGQYQIDKKWMRTQINRQRLIQPRYTIYLRSSDESGDYSLESLSFHLKNPKRPLYLGESDDIIDLTINEAGIVKVEDENYISSKISSVLPGPRVYENCEIVKVPIKLRYDKNSEQKLICSIPRGDIREGVPCIKVCGENVVFL